MRGRGCGIGARLPRILSTRRSPSRAPPTRATAAVAARLPRRLGPRGVPAQGLPDFEKEPNGLIYAQLTSVIPAAVLQDLDDLLDGWGYARVTLVGHSYGAELAARYCLGRPDRLTGLVLLAGPFVGACGTRIAPSTPGRPRPDAYGWPSSMPMQDTALALAHEGVRVVGAARTVTPELDDNAV